MNASIKLEKQILIINGEKKRVAYRIYGENYEIIAFNIGGTDEVEITPEHLHYKTYYPAIVESFEKYTKKISKKVIEPCSEIELNNRITERNKAVRILENLKSNLAKI